MNKKTYIKGMLLIALPATIIGTLLLFLTAHAGSALFKAALFLVPGLWLIDYAGIVESNFAWPVAIIVQVIYWSVIVIFVSYLHEKTNNT
ncbi:MAG: hypothetical protein HYZ31_13565 [Gammaproteobacteria bacterium]|nr:hypothetical protein [Gammaproteobacteria bacterium]